MKRTTLLLVLAAPLFCGSCQLTEVFRRDPDQCNVFFLPPLQEHSQASWSAKTTALALNDRDQVVGYSEAKGELVPVLWRFILDDDLERLRSRIPQIDEILECDRDWPYAPRSHYGDEWSVCVSRLDSPWGVDATANAIANPVNDPNSSVFLDQAAVGKIVGGVGEGLASQIVLWGQGGASLVSDYLMATPKGVTSSGGIVGRRFEFRSPRLATGGFVRWDGDSQFQATSAVLYAITEGAQGPVASGADGLTPVLLRPRVVRRVEESFLQRLGTTLSAETLSFGSDPIQETLGGQGVAFDVEEGSHHGIHWTTAAGYAKDGDIARPATWGKSYGAGTATLLPPQPAFLEIGPPGHSTPMEGRAMGIRRVRDILRVVGWYLEEGKKRAFAWDSKGGGIELNQRKLQCRGHLIAAHDINGKGNIVGVADPDGTGQHQRGFLMVPDVDLYINQGDAFYIKKYVRLFENPPPFENIIPGYAAKGATVTYRFQVINPHHYELEATIVDTLSGAVNFIEVPPDQTEHNDLQDCKLVGSRWDPDERRVEIDLKIRSTCLIDMVVKVRIWGRPDPGNNNFWHNTVPNWDYWLTVKGIDFEHAPIDGNVMAGYFRLLEEPPPPPPPTASVDMVRTLLFETNPMYPAAETGSLVGFRFDVDLGDFAPSEIGAVEVWDRLPRGPDGSPGLALDHSAAEFDPPYESPLSLALPIGFCDPSGAGAWQDAGSDWVKAAARVQGSQAQVCRLITKVTADPPPGEPWLLDNKEYKVIVNGTEFHNVDSGELVAVYEPE